MNGALATADAVFTTFSLACMVRGYTCIKRREIAKHRRFMLLALAGASAFVVSFVVRYVRYGRTPFEGTGAIRIFYLGIWFTHEPIAVISVPLVVATAVLALRGSFEAHREVAQMALPIWLYASVTGVLIYVLVYVLPR